ncbi:MAG: M23 family metallopeptidase [Bacilli bacterium]|nr:M23 family metallopeptidase [Bacilli bacterium]
MEEYARIKNKRKKKKKIVEEVPKVKKKLPIFWFITKLLLTVIATLAALIILKQFPKYKAPFYKEIYEKSISFATINAFYEKQFGTAIPFKDILKKKTDVVFSEKLTYKEVSKYLDGAKLTVDENYLVPARENGMVVFVGEKEGYGNTIILEGTDGVETWYGNIAKTSVKVYDYIDKGAYLGEVKEKSLYLVFKKDGKTLDYTKYVS